ncbi:MAG TPA: DUF3455 domain-containing protein [Burkholderiaceae bacterium]|nr:DUF3455 domain-containing protein [Burkholderiaceae bacterium]
MLRLASLTPIAFLATLFAGCAGSPPAAIPSVPASLQAPPGSHVYLEALATGVQIYECSARPDSTPEWAFKWPEATLSDRTGHPLGKHYAGPTWEANDGSAVVGETKARDPGPTTTAIPWLLLGAKSHSGVGTFTDTTFVQRIATVGGVAPAVGCDASTLKQQARVPYSATYIFYR